MNALQSWINTEDIVNDGSRNIIDDSIVMSPIVASFTIIIYDRNMFIALATNGVLSYWLISFI